MKTIIFTVTNDLNYDQRMQRICHSLSTNGYNILLVGRQKKSSKPLISRSFSQKRLRCIFDKGFLFYAEYNLRLFFFLLCRKAHGLCAIDLDTILPVLFVSRIKGSKRLYDAHELFCEMIEVVRRPFLQKIWKAIERYSVPQFRLGYTVSQSISNVFAQDYGVHYKVIRNMPPLKDFPTFPRNKTILYQGAVNEGRGLDSLLEAWKQIDKPLIVCGDGNYMSQFQQSIRKFNLEDKIRLKGMIPPSELEQYALKAYIGINLVEPKGLNQYYSLANKYFDYIHAGLPQISMNYPEYKHINDHYNVAILINDLHPQTIADAINNLLADDVLYEQLQKNCLEARKMLNWQQEEKQLLQIYASTFIN